MSEPVCLEPDFTPCRFNAQCHVSRRQVQSDAGLRGRACWAFDALIDKIAPSKPDENAASGEAR